MAVDTTGLLMHVIVHSADIQDRDGGAMLMATMFGYPRARPDPSHAIYRTGVCQ
jgi:hypothetical protein